MSLGIAARGTDSGPNMVVTLDNKGKPIITGPLWLIVSTSRGNT
jgi:hypothetical protein